MGKVCGIIKNNKHSYNDFGLKILSRELNPPSKKKIKETLPFMNGSYDFSLLCGENVYEERTIKYVFDMFVINQCTNIQIDGIILNEKDGKSNIEIDITSDAIEKFDSSQIMEKIAPHILNYDEVYNGVKFLIELQNVQKAFGTMGNLIPSIDNMGNVIGTSLKSLTEFKDKDPETFNKIIEQALVKDVVKEKREDIKEIKKAKKTTKTTNV